MLSKGTPILSIVCGDDYFFSGSLDSKVICWDYASFLPVGIKFSQKGGVERILIFKTPKDEFFKNLQKQRNEKPTYLDVSLIFQ